MSPGGDHPETCASRKSGDRVDPTTGRCTQAAVENSTTLGASHGSTASTNSYEYAGKAVLIARHTCLEAAGSNSQRCYASSCARTYALKVKHAQDKSAALAVIYDDDSLEPTFDQTVTGHYQPSWLRELRNDASITIPVVFLDYAEAQRILQAMHGGATKASFECSAHTAYGAHVCQPCVLGRFDNGVASTPCSLCPAGKTSVTVGAMACKDCSVGTYSTISGGGRVCSDCAVGRYSAAIGASTARACAACGAARFANDTGATVCQDCGAGHETRVGSYLLVKNDSTPCQPVRSAAECGRAAKQAGLTASHAVDDRHVAGNSAYPPGCYFESGTMPGCGIRRVDPSDPIPNKRAVSVFQVSSCV